MKYFLPILFLLAGITYSAQAQLYYNFNAFNQGNYGTISSGTNAGTRIINDDEDEDMSNAINIGFNFTYQCQTYTQFKVSSNGWFTFNTALNNATPTNNLATSGTRPVIAPLWDNLETDNNGGVYYRLAGAAPNRTLTIEWYNMDWNASNTNNSWAINFQCKLYETSNIIDFIYNRRNNTNNGNMQNNPSASIGLSGTASGTFLSLDGVGTAPNASASVETTNLNLKPANYQVYRFTPLVCSGAPTSIVASASPPSTCYSGGTSILDVSTSSTGCGIAYQWQSSTNSGGPWVNLGASSSTSSRTVTATSTLTYYRCVVTCSGQSGNSNPVSVVYDPLNIGTGTYSVTLPYSATGQSTCGQGDDVTPANAITCGSDNYFLGEDVVYIFTPTTSGNINIALSSPTGSYTGLMLYNGCPLGGSNCLAYSQSNSGSKSLCASVTAGSTYYLVLDSYDTYCNDYNISIGLNLADVCNMAYNTATTTYSYVPLASLPNTAPSNDDVLYTTIVNFGFAMCFNGVQYFGGYIASNAAFVFDAIPCYPNIYTGAYAGGGVATDWRIVGPAPVNSTSIPRNAVLAPWHDIDPSKGGSIKYGMLGAAPTRTFVVCFDNVPMYSEANGAANCGNQNALNYSGQIKLMESSDIEIHVKNKQVCTNWNNGLAVMGLHNFNGTKYVALSPTAYNAGGNGTPGSPYNQWTMTNTAWKFTNTCGITSSCALLPVEILYFNGNRKVEYNYIKWTTASETNVDRYMLERSTDGKNYDIIAYKQAKNMPSTYDYNDYDFAKGFINYYRITTIDKNGDIHTSTSIGISPLENEYVSTTKVFPNPTDNTIDVGVGTSQNSELEFVIYDVMGRVMMTKKETLAGFKSYRFDVKDFPAGIYYLEVRNNLQVVNKEKFVKY